MKLTQVAITLLFSLTSAVPTLTSVPDKTLKARAIEICGRWDSVVTGPYTVYQNIWGEAAATSGSQCSTIDSLKGDVIVWSTAWTWHGGSSSVKSYANVALTTTGVRISSISSIPTTWNYSYTGTSIVADVSYDIFTSSTATGKNEFEIMIWLAALGGAGPISSTGSPVSTPTINGIVWNLYSGPNGDTTVYSFVAKSQVTSFSGDLLGFFTYLIASKGFSSSQYITTIEAGTEPFTGSDAVLSVSGYSVAISTGAVVATSTTTSATSTSTKVSETHASTSTRATTTSTPNKAFTTSTKHTTTSTSAVATSTGGTIPIYYRCGGIGWTGSGTCASGLTCKAKNAYYYQCLDFDRVPKHVAWPNVPDASVSADIVTEFAFARGYNYLDHPEFKATFVYMVARLVDMMHTLFHFPIVRTFLKKVPESWVEKLNQKMAVIFAFRRDIEKQIRDIIEGKNEAHKDASHVTAVKELLDLDLPPEEKTLNRLRDEGFAMVNPGIETTRWTLSVVTFHLLDKPHMLSTLKAEIWKAWPDIDTTPSLQELERLPYLKAFNQKAIRLNYDVALRLPRTTKSPLQYKSYTIPPSPYPRTPCPTPKSSSPPPTPLTPPAGSRIPRRPSVRAARNC